MRVCIVGTGYVGLVTAACLAEMGNHITCVDIDSQVVNGLKNGKVHIYEPGLEELVQRNQSGGRLEFTTDLKEGIKDVLFVFICVSTPAQTDGSCDLSFVYKAAEEIGSCMQDYKIVVNKSTVPVGTADKVREIITKKLKSRSSRLEFDVVSNPEFLKEGDAVNDFFKPDRVIVGTDNVRTAELLKVLYNPFARSREKLMVVGTRSAEMIKYAANCILATKISFINEVANVCELVGADVREVRRGIGADRRIGYEFIYPGAGYGGSCFPKDVRALIKTAENAGLTPRLLQAIHEVNEDQKLLLPRKIEAYFQPQGGVKDKSLALWGLSFKANTDDMREASSLALIDYLIEKGMRIKAYDPEAGKKAKDYFRQEDRVSIVDDEYQALADSQALAVITEWNQFRTPDFVQIKEKLTAPVIFDGRNLYDPELLADLGFAYFSIGRAGPS